MRVGPCAAAFVFGADRAAVTAPAARGGATPLAPTDRDVPQRRAKVRHAALGESAVGLAEMVDKVEHA